MSEDQALERGSARLWIDLTEQAIEKGCMPVAVIGAKKVGKAFHAALFRARCLPKAVVIEVLQQIVSELEREEAGDGQRVS